MPESETEEIRFNRELWDRLARIHVESPFYDVPGFLKGASSLTRIDLDLLGDVRGKSVLHLQCHFGLDTLSLARMGATVTGVDFSTVAIGYARELNDRLGLDAQFIECDVNRLDERLEAEFDLVYTSFGVLGWHPDLIRWGWIVARFLKSGGRFCLAEFHPVLWMLSDDHSQIAHSYFGSDPIVVEDERSYANPEAVGLGRSYCWNHGLGEVFQALESQGLAVRGFREFDYSPHGIFQDGAGKDGRHYIKGLEGMLPLVFSLTAVKGGQMDSGREGPGEPVNLNPTDELTMKSLVPMLPVRSMPASVEFYRKLGFRVELRNDDWAWAKLACGDCRLMVDESINRDPEAPRQTVIYLYPGNIVEYHRQVRSNGLDVSDLERTFYGMTEFRLRDPDGNPLWIGQNDAADGSP